MTAALMIIGGLLLMAGSLVLLYRALGKWVRG